jgi:hypothetical protein
MGPPAAEPSRVDELERGEHPQSAVLVLHSRAISLSRKGLGHGRLRITGSRLRDGLAQHVVHGNLREQGSAEANSWKLSSGVPARVLRVVVCSLTLLEGGALGASCGGSAHLGLPGRIAAILSHPMR